MILTAVIDIIEITASFYWRMVGFAWRHLGRQEAEMKRKIKPLGNRVLVEPWEPKEMVEGGIVLPETAQEKTNQAVVVSVGEGRSDKAGKRVPIDIKPGDRVLLNKYGGTDVGLEGKTYKIVDADDVLAVVIQPQV
jgi:chaperonin GroES